MPKVEHDQDFFGWTQEQVAVLRSGRFAELDVEHLFDELESMGASERRELKSRLKLLLQHLLKWQCQPDRRSRGWLGIINEQRDQLESLLRQSPSLSRFVPGSIALSYPKARRDAALEVGLAVDGFPVTCPYTEGQILHADYLPE